MKIIQLVQPLDSEGKLMDKLEIQDGNVVAIEDAVESYERKLKTRMQDLANAEAKRYYQNGVCLNISKDIARIKWWLFVAKTKRKLSEMFKGGK